MCGGHPMPLTGPILLQLAWFLQRLRRPHLVSQPPQLRTCVHRRPATTQMPDYATRVRCAFDSLWACRRGRLLHAEDGPGDAVARRSYRRHQLRWATDTTPDRILYDLVVRLPLYRTAILISQHPDVAMLPSEARPHRDASRLFAFAVAVATSLAYEQGSETNASCLWPPPAHPLDRVHKPADRHPSVPLLEAIMRAISYQRSRHNAFALCTLSPTDFCKMQKA
ncbi:hypothetical protein K505DRAFT_332744 [Melanomma pulvis-pyrius CBS 109.77]|uniref:Uncharacterized protein n=1 Tax=Melanomma pulvis-pyrius CBS 109.77 TaxID=1314802 RepID=A0A6A6XSB8_9PLEO|nr:hypothetical protein K505DRAFT_332744 [Melanomma pulvis-pyrius CBS 109.77]